MDMNEDSTLGLMRYKLWTKFSELDLPMSTRLKLIKPLSGKSTRQQDAISEKLLKIVETSKTEEEMIARAEKMTI